MIVVDTNILFYFWSPGEFSEAAEAIRRKDSEWMAPSIWKSEFLSILVQYLWIGRLDITTAGTILDKAKHSLRGYEYEPDSEKVLKLAMVSRCSSYDCEFVALAQGKNVPLVTADKKLVQSFPQIAISPNDFIKTDA